MVPNLRSVQISSCVDFLIVSGPDLMMT